MPMLKKEQALPGAVLKVHDDKPLSDGLGGVLAMSGVPGMASLSKAKSEMTVHVSPHGAKRMGTMSAPSFGAPPGALIEVLDRPKPRDGINTAYVKDLASGREGHVYWCELRACCSLSSPAPQADAGPAAAPKPKRAP